jgi:acyl dehydratase
MNSIEQPNSNPNEPYVNKGSSGVPFMERFFEDYWVEEVIEFGDYLVTEQEIIEFATKYDPQVFHLDKEAAKQSSFGELVGSGWMTVGITMRLMVLHFISPLSSMGSPGVDAIRWHCPVKVNDRLRLRMTTTAKKRSASKPDRGMLWFDSEMMNQNDVVVMTMKGMGMNRCRSIGQ